MVIVSGGTEKRLGMTTGEDADDDESDDDDDDTDDDERLCWGIGRLQPKSKLNSLRMRCDIFIH